MGNACVVQAAVESVGNSLELYIRIHSCGISTAKGSYLLIIVIPQNSPYHASLGLALTFLR
ncbi:MAG: hypothetical protein M0Q14_11990, partial [Tissierellaceae bacterium]|nr:hypothetical protein [Tissierellaceae bacterium]